MKLIRNPELKGIFTLILVILVLGGGLAVATGKLEQWFGITWGPKALDGIVYVSDRSGSSDIWLVDADGSNPRRVTKRVAIGSVPVISPNGSRIWFVGVQENEACVMEVRPDGKALQPASAAGSVSQPSFSPDGKKAAYIANGKVYISEYDGANPEAVLPTEAEIHAAMKNTLDRSQLPPYTAYAWGPDSVSMAGVTRDPTGDELLVYLREPDGKPEIIPTRMLVNELIRQSGGREELPGNAPVGVGTIKWAAEAEVFTVPVFVGEDMGGFLVTFKIEDDKLQVADFKPFAGVVTGLALSPDGSRVMVSVAATEKGMPNGILMIDLENRDAGIVVDGNFMSLSYSPDGSKLLAVQVDSKGLKRDVVTIDPDSGDITRITKDGHSYDPVWTPVSKK